LTVLRAGPDQDTFEKALGRKVLDSHILYQAEADGSVEASSWQGSPAGLKE
jgi:uncharacterized glyoxalase superfamily metalloenzyme YdcJ